MRGLFAALVLLLTACGGTQSRSGGPEARPAWVEQSGASFSDPAVYAVGTAARIISASLRRSTADAQARAELAKVFSDQLVERLRVSDDAAKAEALAAFADMELGGVEIAERYFDTQNEIQYALARLDQSAFSDHLDRLEQLSDPARALLSAEASKLFAAAGQRAPEQS